MPMSISISRAPPADELRLEVHPLDPHADVAVLEMTHIEGGYYLATPPRDWGGPYNWALYHQPPDVTDATYVGRGVIDLRDQAADLARMRECIDTIEAIFRDGERIDRQSITLPDGRSISNTPRASLEMILYRMRAAYATILRTANARPPFEVNTIA